MIISYQFKIFGNDVNSLNGGNGYTHTTYFLNYEYK